MMHGITPLLFFTVPILFCFGLFVHSPVIFTISSTSSSITILVHCTLGLIRNRPSFLRRLLARRACPLPI